MSVVTHSVRRVIIDCETCVMRDLACGDCVVSFLAEPARGGPAPELSAEETRAVAVLAGSGLIPPLRMTGGSVPVRSGGPRALPSRASADERRPRRGDAAVG
jgi:hypothetical protein